MAAALVGTPRARRLARVCDRGPRRTRRPGAVPRVRELEPAIDGRWHFRLPGCFVSAELRQRSARANRSPGGVAAVATFVAGLRSRLFPGRALPCARSRRNSETHDSECPLLHTPRGTRRRAELGNSLPKQR